MTILGSFLWLSGIKNIFVRDAHTMKRALTPDTKQKGKGLNIRAVGRSFCEFSRCLDQEYIIIKSMTRDPLHTQTAQTMIVKPFFFFECKKLETARKC
jgi:hypothetical protein